MFILYTTLSFSPFLKWPFYHAKVKVRNKTYLLWLTFWDIELLICVLITGYERKQWGWNCTHFLHVHIAVGFWVHTDVQWVVASVCPCVSMRESMVPAFPRILSYHHARSEKLSASATLSLSRLVASFIRARNRRQHTYETSSSALWWHWADHGLILTFRPCIR